jgi:hypothetical protein
MRKWKDLTINRYCHNQDLGIDKITEILKVIEEDLFI